MGGLLRRRTVCKGKQNECCQNLNNVDPIACGEATTVKGEYQGRSILKQEMEVGFVRGLSCVGAPLVCRSKGIK
jgi:formylglycine-generating enzyme required for sulfatase activity